MTDHQGDDSDPLLIRPFLVSDSPSAQTWPAAAREVRSHRVLTGAPLTGGPKPAPKSPYPRRLVMVTGSGVAVLAAVTAAGYVALGPGFRPPVSAALPGPPLPAVTGPRSGAPSERAAPSADASSRVASPGPGSAVRTAKNGIIDVGTSAPFRAAPRPAGPTTDAGVPARPPRDEPIIVEPAPPAATAPDVEVDRTGTVGGLNNLCLDLDGGLVTDDNRVQVVTCNRSVTQRWTLAADGSLRVVGRCALSADDGTVHIAGCDGRTAARWHVAGRTLVDAAGARCLTDPGAGTRSGADVTLAPCSGAPEQAWDLP